MDIPSLLSDSIKEGEKIVSRVLIASGTHMITTTERVFIHREEGIINNEIFEEYSLGVDQISVFSDRRKARIVLNYGLEGTREFSVYAKYYDRIVDPLVRGVLKATRVVQSGELIRHVYRYGQLTIVLTDKQFLKHIGVALWSRDYESYQYEDIARIDIEKGGVSAEILIEHKGRMHRIKTDKERARLICVQSRNGLALYRGCKDYQEYEKRIPSISSDESIERISPSVFMDESIERISPSVFMDESIEKIPKISKDDQMIIAIEELETGEFHHVKTEDVRDKLLELEESMISHKKDTENRIREIKDMLESL